ncbi:MAG: heavy metal translocating P-type ATPase, partial [Lachnospiraceae bacterium]|nr:heavy metal translocating P-type ATPase [Lachnospiraceae bacterium]
MKKYDITGMSCAACSARVEKAVSGVPGVTSCSVSLLTNSMGVEGTADPNAIIKAVTDAGYGASPAGGSAKDDAPADKLTLENEREQSLLKHRLILSVVFLLVLMYFSMGHMMWNFPAPKVFDNPVFLGIFEMLLSGLILIINSAFFTSGFKSLFKGGPNMNTLVALGSSVAFGFSLVELFLMADALWTGDHMRAMELGDNLYFESAAMIPTLITVGKLLEAISKGRTTDALKGLMKLTPKTATVSRNGLELTIPAAEVVVDDIFLVRPGESIPVDGVIIEGSTGIDESALTGESIPAEKETGSNVYAATINRTGFIKCRALKVGEDTTLAGIIRIMSDAAATKAPLARIADKVSAIFVPSVMAIALVTFGVWLLLGKGISFSVARAITVLVISCPCALGLATPVAVMVGSGVGAKHGILYKTAASLESLGRSKIVVLDKTGTITTGAPVVTDMIPHAGMSEKDLLSLAASLEAKSEHPLAGAVTDKAAELGITLRDVTDFSAIPGLGLTGTLAGNRIFGGNLKYISEKATLSPSDITSIDRLSSEGKTPLLFAKNGAFAGIIAVRDNVKSDSVAAIRELK